ncbi:MAG: DUF5686 and carboxypeptidase regulatory-like domain-containing protein [Marinifilaceae bacterium]
MKKLLLLLPLLLFSSSLFSQGLKGKITDQAGEPVPFANIYVNQLQTGTTTNLEGDYQLTLPKGNWEILFQYIGFTTQTRKVEVKENTQELNVVLQPRNYQLKEVKVLASGEDPAYYVMRKAISMGQYYTNQVSQYDCQVYLKGSGKLTKIPWLFRKKLKKEGVEKGKTFVTENISKIHFELPDKLKQEVISIRSSGDDNDTSPIDLITANLYDTRDEGLISPLDKNAFSVYRYELESVFEDQGRMINRIKVIPKRKGKDLFKGYLNIAENYWNIHSTDLKLRMPMTDIQMRQIYAPVNENVWMPISYDFSIYFEGVGFGMQYLYVASIKDYNITLNPDLDHNILLHQTQMPIEEEKAVEKAEQELLAPSKPLTAKETKRKEEIQELVKKEDLSMAEVHRLQRLMAKEATKNRPKKPLEIKIERTKVIEGAKNRDSSYWEQFRPIPLTPDETLSFQQKDSVQKKVDSLNKDNNKFKLIHLLAGNTYKLKSQKGKTRLSTPSFIDPTKLSYNTVDGFAYKFGASITHSDTLGKFFSFGPKFRYAFARQHLDFALKSKYRYNGIKRAFFEIEGGSVTRDFNEKRGIDPLLNSITTLFYRENNMKLFRKDYLSVLHEFDLTNGLTLYSKAEYAQRKQLFNHSDFYISNPDHKEFTPNLPAGIPEKLVENHTTAKFKIGLEYTPRYHYSIEKGKKRMRTSDYPTFTISYEKGINKLLGSDSDYDFLSSSIYHGLNVGFNDFFHYFIRGGIFLNNDQVFFPDFHHFSTNKPLIMMDGGLSTFRLLPYYKHSTQDKFLEGHIQFISDRLILKRLPVLNNSLVLQERVFLNYLTQPGFENYYEAGYGLSNIFLLLDIEVIAGFKGKKYKEAGVKLKFNF